MRLFGDETGIYRTYPFEVDRLLFDHNYVPGIAMMRRDAYREVGGLRDLDAFEDWDLFLSFAERGWDGVLVPEVCTSGVGMSAPATTSAWGPGCGCAGRCSAVTAG